MLSAVAAPVGSTSGALSGLIIFAGAVGLLFLLPSTRARLVSLGAWYRDYFHGPAPQETPDPAAAAPAQLSAAEDAAARLGFSPDMFGSKPARPPS